MATTLVKVYSIDPLDDACRKMPDTVHLDAHIDDLVLTCEADPRRITIDLPMAERALRQAIGEGLRGRIAEGKAGLVATTRELVEALRKRIPTVTGPITRSMTNLGTDCYAGRKKGKITKGTKRHKRMAMGLRRAHRLRILNGVIGNKARRIFTAGVAPAVNYGASTRGLSNNEVRKLRQIAASALSPHARNRSLVTTLLLHGDPTAAAEMAPRGSRTRTRVRPEGWSRGHAIQILAEKWPWSPCIDYR